jgi:hypothetical protein
VASPVWGPLLKRAIPSFKARLTDPDLTVRRVAATALWLLQDCSPQVLDDLVAHLRDGLVLPGTPTAEEKQAIERGIAEAEPGHDCMSLHNTTLGLGPRAGLAVPTLQKHLAGLRQGQMDPFLTDTLYLLALIGPAAAPAVPEIEQCLSITFDGVRPAAAAALAFIRRDPRSLPILRQALQERGFVSPDPHFLALAILVLEPNDRAARHDLGLGDGPLAPLLLRQDIEKPQYLLDQALPAFLLAEARP